MENYSQNLAILLSSLSEKISKSNLVKSLLVQQSDFDGYSIFRLLDTSNSQSLTSSEIMNFCKENEVPCCSSEAALLMKWWDRDSDGILSLSDFLLSIIPDSMTLHDITSAPCNPSRPSYALRFSFIRVIQRELNLLRELKLNRNMLAVSYSFNHQDAFALISKGIQLTASDIFRFISQHKITAVIGEVSLLVYRFDTENRSGISYPQFCEILDSGIRIVSETPLASTLITWKSPRSSQRSTESTKFSPFKEQTFRKLSPRRHQASDKDLKKELLSVLMYQIALDKALSELQKELCLMFDFTATEAYKIFDENNNGFITTWDLENSMVNLGMDPTTEEIFLIFRRYDKNCDGKLNLSEFCEFLCTKEKNYIKLLSSRAERSLSQETIDALVKVLASHLTIESSAESLRIEFSQRNDLYKAFSLVDTNQDGFIDFIELKHFFKGKNINGKDIELLMYRYDRNQDNLISYAEFIQELTPQTPHHP